MAVGVEVRATMDLHRYDLVVRIETGKQVAK
jgi:hypothetical protein